ncbi:GspH/FimT family pseudopilin [Hydrogenophaga luteola]|uniref:Type II secretion system protein H n=1 Tax=Hydrogenophaga luteola TaxID=1591122 RepID=A0ABV7W788_9BURK
MNTLPSPLMPYARQHGFTLVELVVTIALVAIVSTLAFPTFSETLRQWRRDSATRALSSSLQLARTEAIKSSRRLVVCSSSDGETCADSSDWKDGWIVFVDDGATDLAYDDGERIISVSEAQGGIASLTNDDDVTALQFMPNGLMAAGATTFTVTPSGATSATKVNKLELNTVGRTSVTVE